MLQDSPSSTEKLNFDWEIEHLQRVCLSKSCFKYYQPFRIAVKTHLSSTDPITEQKDKFCPVKTHQVQQLSRLICPLQIQSQSKRTGFVMTKKLDEYKEIVKKYVEVVTKYVRYSILLHDQICRGQMFNPQSKFNVLKI